MSYLSLVVTILDKTFLTQMHIYIFLRKCSEHRDHNYMYYETEYYFVYKDWK